MGLNKVILPLLLNALLLPTSMRAMAKIYLEDINFNELKLVHKITSAKQAREVYKDPLSQYYIKVWCHDYTLAPDFMDAVKDGFFNETAAITAIIIDKTSKYRGYVTPAGKGVFQFPILFDSTPKKGSRFADAKNQVFEPYKYFYKKLVDASVRTKYAFIDLTPSNMVIIEDRCFLIDLESVRRISTLTNSFFNGEHLPKDYRDEIFKIKNQKA